MNLSGPIPSFLARVGACVVGSVVVYYSARYLWELIPASGDVKKKVVVITGCDTGFGRILALKCAKHGFIVYAGCLSEKQASSLSEEVHDSPGELHTLKLDVTEDRDVQAAKEAVEKRLADGSILWAVVNNAGIFSCYGPDDWCNVADYQLSFAVNTLGVIRVTQAFKRLVKRYKGRIVAVSSVSGRIAIPGGGPYSCSKYALEAYMDTIRQELRPYGVFCSILEPGMFKNTEFLNQNAMKRRVDMVWARMSQRERDDWGEEYKNNYVKNWNGMFYGWGSMRNDYVVNDYFHALTARFPRNRYRCGWDAILYLVPMSFLPTEMLDLIFRIVFRQSTTPSCLKDPKKTGRAYSLLPFLKAAV